MGNLIKGIEICKVVDEHARAAKSSIEMIVYTGHTPGKASHAAVLMAYAALRSAALRPVRCRALFENWPEGSAHDAANNMMASDLAGHGWEVGKTKGGPILHPKIWIFDQQVMIIGSHNFTGAGMTQTINWSVPVEDGNIIDQALIEFNEYFRRAQQITRRKP